MLIQILGTGCPKCQKLAALVEETAKNAGVDYTLEKVTDINKILEFGVMTPPAVVVDGTVKCSGLIPSAGQVALMLK